ncbi:hypothetical protein [Kitasatospora sp. NPDC056181]|uniref:hypothetical protein n=1 Tax=Kitasatospora sp. NPDC056181 TaxID=3345737 RepID=UPI0035D6850D
MPGPVTPKNIDAALGLKVRPDQAHLVAPVASSPAEADAYGESAWPRLVYGGERLVGFVMAFSTCSSSPAGGFSGDQEIAELEPV